MGDVSSSRSRLTQSQAFHPHPRPATASDSWWAPSSDHSVAVLRNEHLHRARGEQRELLDGEQRGQEAAVGGQESDVLSQCWVELQRGCLEGDSCH